MHQDIYHHGLAPVATVQSPPPGALRVGASRFHGLAPVATVQSPPPGALMHQDIYHHGLAPVAIVQSPPPGALRVGASRFHGLAPFDKLTTSPVATDQTPSRLRNRPGWGGTWGTLIRVFGGGRHVR